MIRLILARHGVTAWNQEGRYQGHRDVPLGDAGRAQAARLGMRLARERITAAYASDLTRAYETAEIALAGLGVPVVPTPALRETCFGAWEGMRPREIAARFPQEWDAWIRDPVHAAPPDGETVAEVTSRVLDFYRAVVDLDPQRHASRDWFAYRAAGPVSPEDGGTILVVSHGGPVRALLTHLLEMPAMLYWRFGIRPASVSVLDLYPEGAITEVIGDTSHLG